MNTITKYVSLNMVTLSFFASITTQCMHIKTLKPINFKQLTLVPNNEHTIKRTYHFNPENHEAINSAINLFNSQNAHQQHAAFQVFNTLIKRPTLQTTNIDQQTKIYELAIHYAQIGVTSDTPHVRSKALETLAILVEKECKDTLITAERAAILNIEHESYSVRDSAKDLLNTLFKKNLAFPAAALAAATAIKRNDYHIRTTGFDLFNDLFNHSQGFEAATKAACEAFLDENAAKKCLALKLLEKLTNKNHAFEEAINAAVIGKAHEEKTVFNQADLLFTHLLNLIKKSQDNKS